MVRQRPAHNDSTCVQDSPIQVAPEFAFLHLVVLRENDLDLFRINSDVRDARRRGHLNSLTKIVSCTYAGQVDQNSNVVALKLVQNFGVSSDRDLHLTRAHPEAADVLGRGEDDNGKVGQLQLFRIRG